MTSMTSARPMTGKPTVVARSLVTVVWFFGASEGITWTLNDVPRNWQSSMRVLTKDFALKLAVRRSSAESSRKLASNSSRVFVPRTSVTSRTRLAASLVSSNRAETA